MFAIRPMAVSSIAFMAFSAPAHAYLDPGTASIILQGLIGGGVVAASAVAIYWRRFTAWFKGKKKEPDPEMHDGPGT